MDFKNIIKFLAQIGVVVSVMFFIPILTAWVYQEEVLKFLLFDVGFLGVSLTISLFLLSHKLQMSIKEGVLAVNLVWFLVGVVGGVGLFLGSDISFTSAFFEAVSGFTTTGATIYSNLDTLPHWVLMLRSLMHWLGGMGIVVLGIGLLSIITPSGSLTLFRFESTGVTLEKLTPRIKDTAKSLWKIYLLFTLANICLLYVGGMGLFDSINHAFSTISTGGFSTKNESLGYWGDNLYILWVTTLFMVLSGINFIAHLKALRGDFKGYRSEEVIWYLLIFLLLGISLTLTHLLFSQEGFLTTLTHSFFTIASILTTTGFASTNYSLWSNSALAFIFIVMFIGGNAGSTAGGVKVIRYLVLFKTLIVQLKQILHPSAVLNIFIDRRKLSTKVILSVGGFFVLYISSVLILSFYLFARGYDFLTAFSAGIAIIGNIGPGFGHIGPADNFSLFSDIDKFVLAIFMVIGRLEFYPFFLLFTKEFYKRF